MSEGHAIFFVSHLHHGDRWPGQLDSQWFQIQVLNNIGQAILVGYIDSVQETLLLDEMRFTRSDDIGIEDAVQFLGDRKIPRFVIDAARRQPEGSGDFVNEEGNSTLP
ncbi:hypothetical protein [Humisphaera borealis]|uniref:Uncharacterized protein n=1 Tax=Humisphaera borealis TaxID=2807512 RepID=A0A7M2WQB1_9BACT|nr:hypothetical protein [Humisphaera borealis]QOV87678.1 hypothetical protein IPV69_15440 [Humisphaera borealis]